MDVLREVIDDVQMLYTKKDVVELLRKSKEEDSQIACDIHCDMCMYNTEIHDSHYCDNTCEERKVIKEAINRFEYGDKD